MVPEDRKRDGIVPVMAVGKNITLAALNKFTGGISQLDDAEEQKCILESFQQLKVKTSSPDLAIGRLSGGNQQKAILARCLLLHPRILILDEPTRGIDIGAKYEIYKLINQLVQQGIAVIVISSELPEVLGLSDRVLVMHEGKLKANLINHNLTQEQVMEAALRSEHHVEKQSGGSEISRTDIRWLFRAEITEFAGLRDDCSYHRNHAVLYLDHRWCLLKRP